MGKKLIILLVAVIILVSLVGISHANGWRVALVSPESTTMDNQAPMPKYG